MARPHILIIPPWFDIDFQHNFSKNYHRWARDVARQGQADVGLLYGEFKTGWRTWQVFQNPELDYHYLGVSGWGLPKAGLGWAIWQRQYLRAFQEYTRRFGHPSVIHGYSLLGLIAAWTIGRKHQIPYIYTEVLGSFISGNVADRLVRKAAIPARQASLVTGISPGMVHALNQTFEADARLIPLNGEMDIFTPADIIDGPPRFICIGSPAYIKGLDILVTAMHEVIQIHRSAHLTIIAESRDSSLLTKLIREYKLQDHIEVKGPMAHEQIPEFIRQSHVLVSASRVESLGFTMIEALACGRPVVASASPGAKYIVTEGLGRLVPVTASDGGVNPRDLAVTMMEVYDNRMSYEPEELREMIMNRFGLAPILKEWMEHYHRISKQDVS